MIQTPLYILHTYIGKKICNFCSYFSQSTRRLQTLYSSPLASESTNGFSHSAWATTSFIWGEGKQEHSHFKSDRSVFVFYLWFVQGSSQCFQMFARFTSKIYTVYAVISDIKGVHLYLITPKTWHELLLSLQILFVFNQLREKIYTYRLKYLHESKCTFIKQKMWITLKKNKGEGQDFTSK